MGDTFREALSMLKANRFLFEIFHL